jgi:hypothetical protein
MKNKETVEKPLTAQERKDQIKLIKKAFNRLEYCFSIVSWGQYGKQYWKQCQEESKQHGNWKPEGIKRGLTVYEESQLFYVRTIAEYLYALKPLNAGSFLWTKTSCFYAYALVNDYRKEIVKSLEGIDTQALGRLDYCKLITV